MFWIVSLMIIKGITVNRLLFRKVKKRQQKLFKLFGKKNEQLTSTEPRENCVWKVQLEPIHQNEIDGNQPYKFKPRGVTGNKEIDIFNKFVYLGITFNSRWITLKRSDPEWKLQDTHLSRWDPCCAAMT